MTMATSGRAPASGVDPILNAMVEEVANRLQAGAPVDLEAIARRDPERAELLRQLLPAIAAMADLGRSIVRDASGVALAGSGLETQPIALSPSTPPARAVHRGVLLGNVSVRNEERISLFVKSGTTLLVSSDASVCEM